MFLDGTLYTVRANTQFIVSPPRAAAPAGAPPTSTIQMEYGWVEPQHRQPSPAQVKTPGAVARVHQDSEAFVTFDSGSNRGRFGALRGGMELAVQGRSERARSASSSRWCRPATCSPSRSAAGAARAARAGRQPELDLDRAASLVLSWQPVARVGPLCPPGVAQPSLRRQHHRRREPRQDRRPPSACAARGPSCGASPPTAKDGSQGPWSPAAAASASPRCTPAAARRRNDPPAA